MVTASVICCSGVMSSMIQMLRPCVPTMRSLSRGCTRMSSMRTGRQAGHEPLPVLAAGQRDVERVLGAEIEEVAVLRILLDHVDVALGQVGGDRGPRLPEVARHEHVGLVVVGAMAVERDVARAGIECRRLDARHVRLGRHALDVVDDVLPGRAAVAAHLDVAVVGAHPDDAGHERRFADRDDVAVGRGAVVLRGHRRVPATPMIGRSFLPMFLVRSGDAVHVSPRVVDLNSRSPPR